MSNMTYQLTSKSTSDSCHCGLLLESSFQLQPSMQVEVNDLIKNTEVLPLKQDKGMMLGGLIHLARGTAYIPRTLGSWINSIKE